MIIRVLFTLVIFSASLLAQGVNNRIDQLTARELPSLVELYKHLHSHPELSYQEEATAARLVSELKPLGFDITTGIGGHGFVAVMKNGTGPVVMVRTDLDGLPVLEKTGKPYASDQRTTDDLGKDVAVMHACGHDIHMSSFVGAARLLSQLKDNWAGTLIMIGQPAEERGTGARHMLEAGLFEKWPRPDFALGMHTDAALEAGKIGYRAGFVLANVDTVDITIRGVSGHGAYPHKTRDPIVIAAQVILSLQTIVSRELRPIDPGVVTVGSIHAGTKHNIIPDEAKLQITVRSYTDETRKILLDGIRDVTISTCRAMGCTKDPDVVIREHEFTPSTYNDPSLTAAAVEVFGKVIGPDRVVDRAPVMGGEDFSRYTRELGVPGLIFWLGSVPQDRYDRSQQPGGEPLPSLHSSKYFPDPEPTISTGVKCLTSLALSLLESK